MSSNYYSTSLWDVFRQQVARMKCNEIRGLVRNTKPHRTTGAHWVPLLHFNSGHLVVATHDGRVRQRQCGTMLLRRRSLPITAAQGPRAEQRASCARNQLHEDRKSEVARMKCYALFQRTRDVCGYANAAQCCALRPSSALAVLEFVPRLQAIAVALIARVNQCE